MFFTNAIKVKVRTAANVPYMGRKGQVEVNNDTKVLTFVRRREGRITNHKRKRWNKMRMKFRGNIHKDTLFSIRFHTIEN